jgi:hypothetical protein
LRIGAIGKFGHGLQLNCHCRYFYCRYFFGQALSVKPLEAGSSSMD